MSLELNHFICFEYHIARGDHIVPSMNEAFPKKGQTQETNIVDEFDAPVRMKRPHSLINPF